MPNLPRLTATEAEKILFSNNFDFVRSKGSHRVYKKGIKIFVILFHGDKILHPKIIKSLFKVIEN